MHLPPEADLPSAFYRRAEIETSAGFSIVLKDKDGNVVKEIPAIVKDNQGYDLGQKLSFDIVIGENSIKGSVHWDKGKSIEAEYEW